jgi:photosystem II stability/assembly factor-like uncharacterized protein
MDLRAASFRNALPFGGFHMTLKITRTGIAIAGIGALVWLLPITAAHPQRTSEAWFNALRWRPIGPYRGGRVLAVAGIPSDPNTYYFGAATGGVWKTTNGGQTWTPIFDQEPDYCIGSIAVANSDPNVLYVGTGEACIRGNISFGSGVYKSSDAGRTWRNVGLRDSRHIGRVIVDPRNPDIVLVAAFGHVYGSNPERGVFRSIDGGKTWLKTLYKDDKTGAIDLAFDPNNPRIVFAALWEAHRTPWSLISGGPGSGLYKSTDGGESWRRLEESGLPKGTLGRIGVSVSAADSSRVYAMIEAQDGGLYRSDDGGDHWTRANGEYDLRGRPWYYTHVYADPRNADTVYVLDFSFHRSTDSGKTFKYVGVPHGDFHGLWIDPVNPQRMINGNDGGATITLDGGKSWTDENSNQPTGQFYHVATDNRFPYYVYGSQQDRGTIAIASRSGAASTEETQYSVGGGESGYICPHPTDPNIVYSGSLYTTFTRYDKRTGQVQNISPWPENTLNEAAADAKYRFQWTAPMQISPHDPSTLYVAAQVLFKTIDNGMTWTIISPDLTRNDKSKQQVSGGPITKDQTTVEYYDTIFALAESPVQKDLIWVGTDDGLVQITQDGGKNWANVTPAALPEWSMVSLIEPSPHSAATAYMAVDRHKLDDFRPFIYKTTDFGKTWARIDEGIPPDAYVHAVREDPSRKGLLYAGTEGGIFVSFDDGAHWQSLKLNLPNVAIEDIAVRGDDLAIASYGRGFWILDNVTPLRQIDDQASQVGSYLYKPAIAYRLQRPPTGAVIDYFLRKAPSGDITLEITDSQGRQVQKLSSGRSTAQPQDESGSEGRPRRLSVKTGLNRFTWDMRYAGTDGGSVSSSEDDFQASDPLALPGVYEIKLTVDGNTQKAPLEVKLDPRVKVSQADLEKQFDLTLRIKQKLAQIHNLTKQTRDLRGQLETLQKRLANEVGAKDVVAEAASFSHKLLEVEESLIGWKTTPKAYSLNYPPPLDTKLSMLSFGLEGVDAAPNQPAYEVFDHLSRLIDARLARGHEVLTKDLAALNELMRKEHIPALGVAPVGGSDAKAAAQ